MVFIKTKYTHRRNKRVNRSTGNSALRLFFQFAAKLTQRNDSGFVTHGGDDRIHQIIGL